MSIVQAEIQKLVDTIVELVNPLEIILFGSHARGESSPESDIDLLVVMPEGTHRRNTLRYLLTEIKMFDIAYDLVIATETDLVDYKDDVGFIYYYALKEGKTLYEKRKKQTEIL